MDRGLTRRQNQIRASGSILHRHRLQVRGPELDHHRQRHPVHRQEVLGILRQIPHTCGLVGCGTPTDKRASGACQRHDPPGTEAENLQQAEQIRPEVAHGATLGHLEPEDDPKQSHGLYPFFLVYGTEAILPTDLEYGSPRLKAYQEQQNQ